MRRGGNAAVIIPDGLPEAFEIGDGPVPQRVIVLELEAAFLREPADESRDMRAFNALPLTASTGVPLQ